MIIVKRCPNRSEDLDRWFKEFESKGMNIDELLREACSLGVIEYVKKYLDMGANPNGVPRRGDKLHYEDMPINMSLSGGEDYDFEIAEYLIERGANINLIKGFTTYTSRDDANMYFDRLDGFNIIPFEEKRTKFLVEHGANINEQDLDGETALTCNIKYTFSGVLDELIDYLVSLGADVNVKNLEGKTPLDLAIEVYSQKPYNRYDLIIERLKKYGAKTSEELDKGI